jgi:hypothetical protein
VAEQWELTLGEIEEYLELLSCELDAGAHLESHPEPVLPSLDLAALPPEALSRFESLRDRSADLIQRYSRAVITARDAVNVSQRPSGQSSGAYLNERA